MHDSSVNAKWLKKYTRLEYLESTLRNHELYMGDCSDWPDKNDAAGLEMFSHQTGASGIGVTCLTMATDRFHFWEIYGEREKGVCLWFDYADLVSDVERDPSLQGRQVDYYTVAKLLQQCEPRTLPFAKRGQYADEKEFRVLRQHASAEAPSVRRGLVFRPQSLRRIYLNDWLDPTACELWKGRISAWGVGQYDHVKILSNRTLRYARWIRALQVVANKGNGP